MKVLIIAVLLLTLSVTVMCRAAKDADRREMLREFLQDLELETDMDEFAEEDNVEAMSCDCDYHPGGCTISDKAPPGLACKCKYKGFWTCGGSVTHCKDNNNYYCKHPDRSYQSCKQGEGDCGGYR